MNIPFSSHSIVSFPYFPDNKLKNLSESDEHLRSSGKMSTAFLPFREVSHGNNLILAVQSDLPLHVIYTNKPVIFGLVQVNIGSQQNYSASIVNTMTKEQRELQVAIM